MDHGRYAPQHGWEDNSALDGYGVINGPDYRSSRSYNGRRFVDDGFPGDSYRRDAFYQDTHDKNMYPPAPSAGNMSSQPRRLLDEEYSTARDYRRNKRIGSRDRAEFHGDFEEQYHSSHQSREDSYERDHDYEHYSYGSDHEKHRRDDSWRRRDLCESAHEKRGFSHERDRSPYMHHSRSRSRGHGDQSRSQSRSRSPRGKSHQNQRDGFYDDNCFSRRREYDWDERRHGDLVAPSATVVVKGLSQKTNEDDLNQILADWGPLRSVRVIKERSSGMSRGFAFIDFPTVEAARRMMEGTVDNGLSIDGRKVFCQYSSKPTSGMSEPSHGEENFTRYTYGHRTAAAPCDWICTLCGCMNFARRTSCFQTEDSLPADPTGSTPHHLKRGSELGPTHVLVVRGLDENADEEMLRYEFAKHAPIKDIRLVRDKFTHVSRGFAFIHFHSVEDATKALEATNGITLEKNGQVLRVAYAKSTHGPVSGASQSSSLAAAAIEAASFSQQYDAVGWAPKEYNPDDKLNSNSETQNDGSAPQSGFVWDEKSGYYYDSSSGFYYDGNTGLYYDGNAGIWYSYDQQTQQYVPCSEQNSSKAAGDMANASRKTSEGGSAKNVVISAPAATIKQSEKTSLPEAVQAAASAALAAEKKEKEKAKEIKLASKGNLLANKKKMNNVLAIWKQRNQEGQAGRVVLDDKEPLNSADDKLSNLHSATGFSVKGKPKFEFGNSKDMNPPASYSSLDQASAPTEMTDSDIKPTPFSNSLGTTIMGVIRGSGRGILKPDIAFHSSSDASGANSSSTMTTSTSGLTTNAGAPTSAPFRTELSGIASYTPAGVSGSAKRRFSEAPGNSNYRDRAAERRSLYGSSLGRDNVGLDQTGEYPSRRGSSEMGSMPFPPGVGERSSGEIGNTENYEVITADRAIDESNVGNRILRNMGWQEGRGLGKSGSGIKEPVQAKSGDVRAGLGSQQHKADPSLEAKAGDSYKTIIQKKAIARFREMS
ncbi:hypothetical protein GUJ93_ZPchr0002g24885 [Zizania palustris]|uniref:SUPPRESSOR OF ABI3-5 n=1 Tax=Zizania palustris TaxID=103762 RepID=A0A8J5RWT8_ZIZPA|nr:hypothetical protein GUJ93_ZPchr0002g24885 [Zizania palustris]